MTKDKKDKKTYNGEKESVLTTERLFGAEPTNPQSPPVVGALPWTDDQQTKESVRMLRENQFEQVNFATTGQFRAKVLQVVDLMEV